MDRSMGCQPLPKLLSCLARRRSTMSPKPGRRLRPHGRISPKACSQLESIMLALLPAVICYPSRSVAMSAASCVTQLDHQTCRGSSIGRACGSYHQIKYNLKVAGSSPAFGYSYIFAVISFWRLFVVPENSFFFSCLKCQQKFEVCRNFCGPTPAQASCQDH